MYNGGEETEKIKAKGAITKTGDIWKLGVQRLMCVNSTSEVDFAKLIDSEIWRFILTVFSFVFA